MKSTKALVQSSLNSEEHTYAGKRLVGDTTHLPTFYVKNKPFYTCAMLFAATKLTANLRGLFFPQASKPAAILMFIEATNCCEGKLLI